MTDATVGEAPRLPPHLRDFADTEEWTFAKRMPEWPHEYIVRDPVAHGLFDELVHHSRRHGRASGAPTDASVFILQRV